MEYEVKPIFLGTIEADQSGFTYMVFPGTPIKLDVVFFLITGGPKTILFDTGSWADLMANYWPGKGWDYQSFEEGLAKEGLTPSDIDIIVQGHLHHDHVGNTAKCVNASVYVQQDEWSFCCAPHPLHAGYYPPELYKGWNMKLIKGDKQLFPGIEILHTPGHTPGTQSLTVETKEGLTVIPGFCCTHHTFEDPKETLPEGHPFAKNWEVFIPAIATDLCEAYNSTLRLKSIADVILPCHGPGFGDYPEDKV